MAAQLPLGTHHQVLADAPGLLLHPPDVLWDVRQPLQQAGAGGSASGLGPTPVPTPQPLALPVPRHGHSPTHPTGSLFPR